MKNALLMAILMGFVGFSCANVEMSKAQLLAHLKSIRAEIMYNFEQAGLSRTSPEFNRASEFLHEFYSNAEALQKILINEIAHPEFDIICNNILTLEKLAQKFDELPTHQRMKKFVPFKGGLKAQDPVEIDSVVRQELFESFVPVCVKWHQEICEKEQTAESMKDLFDELLEMVLWYPETLQNDWPLLKLIDAKIAELEAQV